MVTTFVKHSVNDFSAWKVVYDQFKEVGKSNGVVSESVFRDPNSPDEVIVTHDFNSLKSATDFFNSPELKSAMADAGVSSQPEIWFGEKV